MVLCGLVEEEEEEGEGGRVSRMLIANCRESFGETIAAALHCSFQKPICASKTWPIISIRPTRWLWLFIIITIHGLALWRAPGEEGETNNNEIGWMWLTDTIQWPGRRSRCKAYPPSALIRW